MASTAQLHVRDALYVGGAWVPPAEAATIDVVNPATEEVLGRVPAGTAADVDAAVAAARAAFPGWAATPMADRAAALSAVAAGLEARADELALLIASELGMPVEQARFIQVGLALATFSTAPLFLEEVPWEQAIGNSTVVREPVGVVGAITPWNYPLHQIAAKVAAAIAVGCTVVVKPSEVTPLNAFVLAEVVEAAGLPAGVFNLVSGTGPVVGEALAGHPGVDMVSFTGSTRAGAQVQAAAARTVKPVALELGGKSANVVLDDADLMQAVPDALRKCFINSGQTCSALTRLLVPRERYDEAVAIAAAGAAQIAVGDPLDPASELGPLVSDVQRERVRGYITGAEAEGARVVAGGVAPPHETGYYVSPTVIADVTPDMAIHREEVFGPVLVVLPHDGDEDAIRLANDSDFGLSGGVWSADEDRAVGVAKQIRTGQVEVNGASFNPLAPFGGVKQSGHGREYGPWGLVEFTTTKAIQR